MNNTTKIVLVVVLILVIGYFVYYCSCGKTEGFTWANAVESQPGNYSLGPGDYEMVGDCASTDKFADLVGPVDPNVEGYCQSGNVMAATGGHPGGMGTTPMQQRANMAGDLPLPTRSLDATSQSDMLPVDPTSVTMFDRDVTDPALYLFRPSIRAQIKNRQQEGADPFRGDLPITPCRRGWFDSRYGEGDNKLDAYFSAFNNMKYAFLTGQRNLPMQLVNEELIMDGPDPILAQY